MSSATQRFAASMLSAPAISRAFERLVRGCATVFVCHRFDVDVAGQRSDESTVLRGVLERLRGRRYHFVSVEDVVRAHRGEGRLPERAVAFTIDDGYAEQVDVARDVFASLDCPVTIFLTTGFVDGEILPWWDQIAAVCAASRIRRLTMTWPDGPVDIDRRLVAPNKVVGHLTERAKTMSPDDRRSALELLAEDADVPLPVPPCAPFTPVSWDAVRGAESELVTFGPHTITHPLLSYVDDEQAHREIEGSWRRLHDELARPVPVFCYPNGRISDFTRRDVDVARGAGLIGAVTVDEGYANPRHHDPFYVRRVNFPHSPDEALAWATGRRAVTGGRRR